MSTRRSIDALRMTKPELAVVVSGITSMGLEILAGRMIAPQFGSSIYTWGSIIGVFLAALSWGYYRGGKRAANRATNGRMARMFLLTAAYVAVLIFLGDMLVRGMAGFPLPSRFASLPAITLLFGPPTYFLGYVSPYAAELSGKEGLGEASGHVYALGTIGSIVGAFATTFLLIPSLGVDQIALVFGVLSVGTAAVLVGPGIRRSQAFATGVVVLLLVGSAGTGAVGFAVEGEVVYETQTPYQELEVVDRGDTRTLYLDGQRHSAMDLDDPNRHVYDYTRYFHLPLLMTDDVDKVLFVGGGGFTGPKRFANDYDVEVHVAEIDPEVIAVSKEYFRVEESANLTIHNADGRRFLRNTNETYDLIVLDAYKKDKVPFQLTTVEFMELTKSRLADDGVLMTNLISAPTGPASKFYRAEYRTVDSVFPQTYSFPTAQGSVVQNVEVIATKDRTRLTEGELLERNDRRDIGIDLSNEIRNYREPPSTDDVPLLTDDHAPVDSLMDPMVGQEYVVQQTNRTEAETEPDGNETAAGTNETDDGTTRAVLDTPRARTASPAESVGTRSAEPGLSAHAPAVSEWSDRVTARARAVA